MHTGSNRRTATKVKDGRVQRKNRHRPTGHDGFVLDRESPGRGFRHVVTKRDVQMFIDIIPDWHRLSERLERIVLASRSDSCDGRMSITIVRRPERFSSTRGATTFSSFWSSKQSDLTKRMHANAAIALRFHFRRE